MMGFLTLVMLFLSVVNWVILWRAAYRLGGKSFSLMYWPTVIGGVMIILSFGIVVGCAYVD
jgi:TRAP-type C4-dicarboxylate transport system permease small subunit